MFRERVAALRWGIRAGAGLLCAGEEGKSAKRWMMTPSVTLAEGEPNVCREISARYRR